MNSFQNDVDNTSIASPDRQSESYDWTQLITLLLLLLSFKNTWTVRLKMSRLVIFWISILPTRNFFKIDFLFINLLIQWNNQFWYKLNLKIFSTFIRWFNEGKDSKFDQKSKVWLPFHLIVNNYLISILFKTRVKIVMQMIIQVKWGVFHSRFWERKSSAAKGTRELQIVWVTESQWQLITVNIVSI